MVDLLPYYIPPLAIGEDSEQPKLRFAKMSAAKIPCGREIRLLSGGVQEHVRLRFGNFFAANSSEEDVVKALSESLSPCNCIHIREMSLEHESLSQLTAFCDDFIRTNLSVMLSERELISLPRVQVSVDVSEHKDIRSADLDVLERMVPTVVRELSLCFSSAPNNSSGQLIEEKSVSMELLSDLSVQMAGSTKPGSHSSESPEKSLSDFISLTKKPISPARRLQLGPEGERENRNAVDDQHLSKECSSWEILATHSISGMNAMSVVKRSEDLMVLNIQMVVKGSSNVLCPISPTTGVPLAMNDAFFAQMTQSRSGFGLATFNNSLMSVGGFDRSGVLCSTECFSCEANTWVAASDLVVPRARLAVVDYEHRMYAIGGSDGKSELNSVEMLSDVNEGWKLLPSNLSTARSEFGAAVLNDRIYAVGGSHYSNCLRSVEAFDPVNQKWKNVASMLTPRKGVAVVSCNGMIYAIGGQLANSWRSLSSVECYQPAENQWREVAPMSIPRRNACAITVNDRIYIIGGYNGSTAVSSIEAYDPVNNEWSEVTPMVLKRSSAAAVLVQGGIYVVGGFSGSRFLNSVEKLDLESGQWTSYFSL